MVRTGESPGERYAGRVPQDGQRGAVTVLVALGLLGLVTAGALGLARGTMRETLVAGTRRPAEQATALAESGLDWTLVAMEGPPGVPTGEAVRQRLAAAGSSLAEATAWIPVSTLDGTHLPAGETAQVEIGLTRLGQVRPHATSIRPEGMAPGLGQGAADAMAVWRVQGRSVLRVGGVLTFKAQAEAWVVDPRGVPE